LQHDAAAAMLDGQERRHDRPRKWNGSDGHSTTLGMAGAGRDEPAVDRRDPGAMSRLLEQHRAMHYVPATANAGSKRADSDSAPNEDADNASSENSAAPRKVSRAQFVGAQPTQVVMLLPGIGVRPFTFPKVFGVDVDQVGVFESLGKDVVMGAMSGFNACLITYGQTGSGSFL